MQIIACLIGMIENYDRKYKSNYADIVKLLTPGAEGLSDNEKLK